MNSQEKNKIEKFYDQYADRYTKQRIDGGLLFNEYIERPALINIIKSENNLKDKSVLDIGCGPGIYTKDIASSGAQLTAIDASERMLKLAMNFCKDSLPVNVYSSINFLHTSFEDLSCDDNKFNLIIATFMLSYFSDLSVFFNKTSRILQKDGRIISSILHPIRMASNKGKQSYTLNNYFKGGYYKSDFLSKNNLIKLKRWSIEEISKASYESGLFIEKILEPRPINIVPPKYSDKSEFYKKNPSILMFLMKKI